MYGLAPIELFNVNDFKPIQTWEISNGTTTTVAFILTKTDSLGTRRFIPPAGSLVQLQFVRARAATATSQAVTLTKTGVVLADDKSIYQVSLSADDTKNIISGGIQLALTISGQQTLINIPYLVKKCYSSPGF